MFSIQVFELTGVQGLYVVVPSTHDKKEIVWILARNENQGVSPSSQGPPSLLQAEEHLPSGKLKARANIREPTP